MSEGVSLSNPTKVLKMATSQPEELKEFEKLDLLLSQIPKKAQHGIMMSCDLVLTCIDANSLYIVLGTNVGVTFLWSRRDCSMQRLRTASTNNVITCVRLHHGMDEQLAVATASGDLSVYIIPGFASVLRKQLQKFEVTDIHKHYVTCLEWSMNGMKLYSGDKNGLVGVTEVDFYQDQCKSSILLVEPATEIIQLDYKHKILLVSTRQSSFIVRLDLKAQVITIGTQDRKIQGSFGACFRPGQCKIEDAKVYAARPGYRLWLSDVSGTVINTHIFTDPFSQAVPEVPLLSAGKLQIGQPEFQFGILKCFREREIITWSNQALVVLDPWANRVVARQSRLNGIVGLAIVEDSGEIFLLRRHAEARVIRIAASAEVTIVRDDILSVRVPVKPTQEKDNAPQSFFQKLTNPLKHLDKPTSRDSRQELELSAPVRADPVTSQDLPPVVRLASPELEGVRMFTGGSVDTYGINLSFGVSIDPSHELPVLTSASSPVGHELPVLTSASSPVGHELPVLTSASSPVVTASADASSNMSWIGSEVPLCPDGPAGQGESPPTENTEGGAIVFTHRMRKHRRRKLKEGLLAPKHKESDTISLTSVCSQLSDDGTAPPTSSGTSSTKGTSSTDGTALPTSSGTSSADGTAAPTSSADGTALPTSSGTSSADGTSLNILQCADEMLTLVDRLLNNGSGYQAPPGLAASTQAKDLPASKDMPESAVVTSVDKPHNSVDSRHSSSAISDIKVCSELSKTCNVTEGEGHNVKDVIRHEGDKVSDVTEGEGKTVEDDISCVFVPIYDPSENLATSFLSECDQHQDGKAATTHEKSPQNHAQSDTVIVEHAMANLARSRAADVTMETYDTESCGPSSQSSSATNRLDSQNSFQDIYSEIEVIESSDPFHKGYKRDRSLDDFYSLFLDTSPESPVSPEDKPPLSTNKHIISVPSGAEGTTEMVAVAERRLANTWSEFSASANIYSLALSNNHVWFTDKSEKIYYSTVGTPKGILWRNATGHANQISVSPSGQIVWRLHRGVVYAGSKISSRHPEGLKWIEALRDVDMISVDNDCAWFVMRSGEVMMQRRLSSDRPCYKSMKVDCHHRLKHIIARCGLVWAVTDKMGLLVRTGVSDELPEGTGWQLDNRESPPYLLSHVALDNENIGWAIDVLGQVWFCDRVTREQPLGRGQWWQVPLSEYILHDMTTLDLIRGLARKFDPKKLSDVLSTNRGGLVVAGSHGVWLAMGFKNVLQVCQGNVQGYHWLEAQPAQMSPSSSWKQVCAEVSHLDWGLMWAQHTNGDVFTFRGAGAEASVVHDCASFSCIAVGPTATWALTSTGVICIRSGMAADCPQGTGWVELDISQLGDARIVHLSCNSLYVWAVEAEGTVYQRIGAKPPSENNLSPAWLAIDTFSDIVFTRVDTGPLDWMVWAIDNCKLIYVRAGITDEMPIGQEWVNVPGIQAMDLAVTRSGVWALTPNGEICFRYGIARDRPCGNYWKKIPGTFIRISASANDELWGINSEGQLMQCSIRYLTRHQGMSEHVPPTAVRASISMSEDVDWEIV